MPISRITVPILAAVLSALACGSESSHVEISGDAPAVAAAKVTNAMCAWDARCGRPVITCTGSGGGGAGGGGMPSMMCTGTIEKVDEAACRVKNTGDLAELLMCAMPSEAGTDLLETCADAYIARPCPTQADVDRVAADASMGKEGARPWDAPVSCMKVEDEVFGMCLPGKR